MHQLCQVFSWLLFLDIQCQKSPAMIFESGRHLRTAQLCQQHDLVAHIRNLWVHQKIALRIVRKLSERNTTGVHTEQDGQRPRQQNQVGAKRTTRPKCGMLRENDVHKSSQMKLRQISYLDLKRDVSLKQHLQVFVSPGLACVSPLEDETFL